MRKSHMKVFIAAVLRQDLEFSKDTSTQYGALDRVNLLTVLAKYLQ